MGLKKINGELERIAQIVSRWSDAQSVSDIERELVLDKLKSLYEEVMFFEREMPAEDGPMAAPEAFEAEESAEPLPGIESETVMDGRLFDVDDITPPPARSTLDRKVILSLYGDEPAACSAAEPVSEDTMLAGEQAVTTALCEPEPAPQEQPEAEPVVEPEPEPTPEPVHHNGAPGQVLGEVINAGAERLGDALARGANNGDVASHLASAATQSLRGAIGINDRFQIISEVFNGDAAAYEQAIDDLESYEDLDELMIHIHDRYSWNPNAEGTKTLIEILTRKFS